MNAVMLSIRPEWCEKIANGRKTLELRKSFPKLKLPFKCYIYCTLAGSNELFKKTLSGDVARWNREKWADKKGCVIGEFICDSVLTHCEMANADLAEQLSGVRREEILEYAGGKEVYGWHISELKIYDTPKALSEFITPSEVGCCNEGKCRGCHYLDRGNGFNTEDDCTADFDTDCYKPLRKPPQSWCYVEGASDE